ncbi:phage tail tube protein [Paenibacillus paeoniae]|uniref:Phage tail protein n=1 Tax=Paenibacillus paeoniae TaxID=2292705 RepID=A0A371P076_9BACL|nr:phage tail tube protein [Paenibacillus paeoniae]REK69342.1 phage tail protein [Paenibacillus paeoniae]
MPQGVLTKDTTLSYRDGGTTWKEIELLMEVPELGGDPEQIDVTTLKDGVRKYIPGVKDLGDLSFQFLYDNSGPTSNFRVLKGFQDEGTAVPFKVEYPDGTAHEFSAMVNVKMDSSAVNAALQFTASFFLQSDITVTNPT